MALAAQFILFIMELMRILEQVAGETAAGYIRRHTPLDGALADLRAIVAGLPCPSSSDSESDDWESEESEFAEDWPGWLYPEPIPRADPASTPACAARMRSEIRACGPGNVEKAKIRHLPFHAYFVTITKLMERFPGRRDPAGARHPQPALACPRPRRYMPLRPSGRHRRGQHTENCDETGHPPRISRNQRHHDRWHHLHHALLRRQGG
jgi:hypothetical protein